MNLLESVLLTSDAEQYKNNFKEHGIDAFSLKLLNDEDLRILGVKEEEKRISILEKAKNLQIPAEKPVEILIDYEYINLVLQQMSFQLVRQLATLSIAVQRNDVVICDTKLTPAAFCLIKCVDSLRSQLIHFESKFNMKKNKRNGSKYIALSAIILVSIPIIMFGCNNLLYNK